MKLEIIKSRYLEAMQNVKLLMFTSIYYLIYFAKFNLYVKLFWKIWLSYFIFPNSFPEKKFNCWLISALSKYINLIPITIAVQWWISKLCHFVDTKSSFQYTARNRFMCFRYILRTMKSEKIDFEDMYRSKFRCFDNILS